MFGWLLDHAIDGIFVSTVVLLGPENSGEAPATVSPDYHQPGQPTRNFCFCVHDDISASLKHCVQCLLRIVFLVDPAGSFRESPLICNVSFFFEFVRLPCMIMRRWMKQARGRVRRSCENAFAVLILQICYKKRRPKLRETLS